MGVLKNIQETIGGYFLNREVSFLKRERNIISIQEAKTVGIIFDSSDKEEFELVKKYINYLKEMKKRVKAIGYFSNDIVPELTYSKLEFDFFTPKQLNWYQRPSNVFVENFINEENDVLIDLNIYDRFPLRYIGAASRSKFKIGKFSDKDKNIYDMMIHQDESKGLKYFLRQVDIYLFMINNKEQTTN